MDHLDQAQVLKRELGLLKLVVNFGFQNDWITEIEQLRINTKKTLDLKRLALLEILLNTKCDENAARLFFALRCIDEMKLEPPPSANTLAEQDYYFSLIMSKLYAKGLVTKEQNLIYETRLLAAEKEKLENLTETNRGTIQVESHELQSGDERNSVGSSTNPLLIGLVIKCVLQYLDIDEIKNARYISKVWSSVGLTALKSRSSIAFFGINTDLEPTARKPLDFLTTFPPETPETVSFNCYCFCGYDTEWAIEELNYFFRNQKKHMRQLGFNGVHLVDENFQPFTNYDISSWILNSAMTKPNSKYDTSLEILITPDYSENHIASTMLFVQLSALENIKEVRLLDCGVYVQEEVVISPPKIEIKNVSFHKNGNQLTEICVNDIVDFSKSEEIVLVYTNNDTKVTKMNLEMGGNADIKLESLILLNVTLKNIRICRWTVSYLDLHGIPFIESSPMEINELAISSSQVDLSVLPQSIHKLTISRITQGSCVCSQPTVLQNLKAVKFSFSVDSEIIELLQSRTFQCPLLVELDLEHTSRFIKEINLSGIPQTVKILKLEGVYVKREGTGNLELDTLVLSKYFIDQVEECCGTHLRATNLVLSFPNDHIIPNVDDFLDFVNTQQICRGSGKLIYVGQFYWAKYPEIAFEVSSLRQFVDRKAEYYVFEHHVGRAIDFEEFSSVMESSFE